jgi:hypothetical protein
MTNGHSLRVVATLTQKPALILAFRSHVPDQKVFYSMKNSYAYFFIHIFKSFLEKVEVLDGNELIQVILELLEGRNEFRVWSNVFVFVLAALGFILFYFIFFSFFFYY